MKTQTAQGDNWLFKEVSLNDRLYAKTVLLPDNADYWLECTNEEKVQWEREHSQPELEPSAE